MRAIKLFVILVCSLFVLNACNKQKQEKREEIEPSLAPVTYLEKRSRFITKLKYKGPSPQVYKKEIPPEGVDEVYYFSDSLKLKAWIYKPAAVQDKKLPALVYFHGGFALSSGDYSDCKPFLDTGFVVMLPMFRGENGNPGNFEMLLGEVDDALAAIEWLVDQPYVDTNKIYGFGHSTGGVISALMAMFPKSGLRHSGSSGGLYGQSLFAEYADAPFDKTVESERELRCLVGNIKEMKKPHYAYVGTNDSWQELSLAKEEVKKSPGNLIIVELEGDHFSVLPESFKRYLKQVQEDIQGKKN